MHNRSYQSRYSNIQAIISHNGSNLKRDFTTFLKSLLINLFYRTVKTPQKNTLVDLYQKINI